MPLHDARSLLALLREHDLVSQGPLDELRPLAGQFPAAADLARELVRRGLLTEFQADEIMQDRAGRLVLGQYLLLERLGQGGMGEVYKARHRVLDRLVALKIIRAEYVNHAEAVERFRRECRAAGRLSHPNIVTVHDAHQAGGVHFMAMEFLEGQDLARLLQRRGALPPGEACEYARQAALGLQHAHEQGMVHRDVKPANLMLTTVGVVKVLDLGLARLRAGADGEPRSDLTRAGSIMGTPDYIAPEQAAGDSAGADIRADVYSLGCKLFHLLTGRPPFGGKTVHERIAARLMQPPPRVDEVRPGLEEGLAAVVRRMMDRDPAARFQTPGEVAVALEPYCHPSRVSLPAARPHPAHAETSTWMQRPRPRRPFPWRVAGIAAAAAVLIASAVAVVGWMRQAPPRSLPAKPPTVVLSPDKDRRPVRPPLPGPIPVPINLLPLQKHAIREGLVWPPPECIAVLGDDAGRHWGEVQCAAFRPDGKVMATADRVGAQAFVHLWDADTLKERAAWTPAGLIVLDLAYSPDGKTLAAACGDGLRLWDASDDGLSNERKYQTLAPGSSVKELRFAEDGKALVIRDLAGAIRKWRLKQGEPENAGDADSAPSNLPAAISADGRMLAYATSGVGAGKPMVRVRALFDRNGEEASAELSSEPGSLALSADGKRLAARFGHGELRVWDVAAGQLNELKRIDISRMGLSNFVPAFKFMADGGKLA